jgi:hypothetical protein
MKRILLSLLLLTLFLAAAPISRADWSTDQEIGQTSRMAPALAFFNNQLHLVHPSNSKTDDFLYWSVYANGSWSNNVRLAKERCKGTGPALVATSSQLVLIYRGESTDGNLWMATVSDNQWSAGQQMKDGKGNAIKGAEGIAAAGATDSSGQLFAVYRDKKNNVWYTKATGTAASWTTPIKIASVQTKAAPALTMMSSTLHMQIVGTDSKIYDCVQNANGKWTASAIPGAVGTKVGSSTVGGVLYVVFLGESDRHMWFTSYQTSGWAMPTQIKDHDATYAPALAGDSSTNTLYMVHVGKGGSKLYFSYYKT